ncbi:hypothetical protein [Rhizobacter sp. Root404]|jgi:hypothetical protein|uniref:hypothetical protein n=1 Tax=Rhizobacter sp. Root404 TaxID=1736528 RepID=UPI0006F3C4BC|nr:hypothetical protein [Rhizobacter sp. Root404]KQW38520.1 hypothetical protein ASC76_10965 [Rhizobacter sp. Root404]
MRRLAVSIVWASAVAFGPGAAVAAPMGFKGSVMAMGDLGPNWRESWANYAFTARDAIGAGGLYMRSDDETKTRTLAELNYTRLLQRWNLEDAQANVWLFAGIGSIRGNDFAGSKLAWAPGVQVDFETTRVYLAATARLYRASGLNHDFGSLRAGFSFYEVDYDEIQPWLVLEARRMRGLSDKTEITPMLRLIHNRYFVELGVNTARQARANFMYVF